MKKAISFIVSCALCLGLTVPAMAAPVEVMDTVAGGTKPTLTISDVVSQETLKDYGDKDVALYTIAPGTTLTTIYNGEQSPDPYDFMLVPAKREGNKILMELDPSSSRKTATLRGNVAIVDSADVGYWYVCAQYTGGTVTDFYVYVTDGKDTSAASPTGFSDVATDAYYADAVKWAVEKGITSGTTTTTFSPDDTCTKAQILTFLWRANGSPEPGIPNCFEDVNESAYYYKAAVWACENGLIMDRWFGGDAPCTRIETVTYLWTLAGQPAAANAVAFTDLPDDADSVQAVAWAVEKGITSGTSATTFAPDTTCTRGQIVTFLYRDMAQ